jgi:hypothetical protein
MSQVLERTEIKPVIPRSSVDANTVVATSESADLLETETGEEPEAPALTETAEEKEERELTEAVIGMTGWVSLVFVWQGLVEGYHWHFGYAAGWFAIAVLLFGCVLLSKRLQHFIVYGVLTLVLVGVVALIVEAWATLFEFLHWLINKL